MLVFWQQRQGSAAGALRSQIAQQRANIPLQQAGTQRKTGCSAAAHRRGLQDVVDRGARRGGLLQHAANQAAQLLRVASRQGRHRARQHLRGGTGPRLGDGAQPARVARWRFQHACRRAAAVNGAGDPSLLPNPVFPQPPPSVASPRRWVPRTVGAACTVRAGCSQGPTRLAGGGGASGGGGVGAQAGGGKRRWRVDTCSLSAGDPASPPLPCLKQPPSSSPAE